MESDLDYFGEALQRCANLDIKWIITLNKDFDPELVAQFYATVHFGHDEARTLTWMTSGKRLSAQWKDFMESLSYNG